MVGFFSQYNLARDMEITILSNRTNGEEIMRDAIFKLL